MLDLKKYLILDIDQTLIDSSIRENFCYKEGVLCLETYKRVKHSHIWGICNDTLTPFGAWCEDNANKLASHYNIIILTARYCEDIDYAFFDCNLNQLKNNSIFIARDNCLKYGGNPNDQASATYKAQILKNILGDKQGIMLIDDCYKVLEMAKNNGYKAINATKLYHYNNCDFSSLFGV